MHCIRGRNQHRPAPQAPPTTNHQQHQQGQWRQARGGRSAESIGVLTFLGCITMPYWNNWYLQKWFFLNEVMVLLYIIVLSFFDHLFSCLPATEIDFPMNVHKLTCFVTDAVQKDIKEWCDRASWCSCLFISLAYDGLGGLRGCWVAVFFPLHLMGQVFGKEQFSLGWKSILFLDLRTKRKIASLLYATTAYSIHSRFLKPVTNCTRCSAIGATVIPGEF